MLTVGQEVEGERLLRYVIASSDMRYIEMLQALKDLSVKGLLVCESPDQETDALIMQETYRQLKKQR